jgi:hypothetical protein
MMGARFVGAAALVGGLFAAGHSAAAEPADKPPNLKKKELAPQPSVSSLEISGTVGPTYVFGDAANPEYVQSVHRGGFYGELGVSYRSSYFVDPFLSVGYATLASGVSRLPDGLWGAGGTMEQHLGAWVISPGITSDIWRFRPRFGLGVAVIVQSFSFNGDENSSTQTPLAAQLGLGFNMWDDDRFRFDLESRAIVASGADVTFVTLDAVLRGDLFYFIMK